MTNVNCESCGVLAVGHSTNPDWSGYNLCQECIEEYDGRVPINSAVSHARYRIIVGEVGSETGHIVDTAAKSEHGARIVLGRELAKYAGDGWGRIEVDLYGDGRWDSDAVRNKGE